MKTAEASHQRQNSHLTFKANTGEGRHGWLRLTPAYGVRLVRDRISHLPKRAIVTDPFSGTGTTPLAAAELGHLGQSIDINPFLVWLGRMKTRHYPAPSLDSTLAELPNVMASAKEVLGEEALWQPDLHGIHKWWSLSDLNALKALRFAIDQSIVSAEQNDLLEIALCRTLIARSNAAFNHQSMSFKSRNALQPSLFQLDGSAEALARFESEVKSIVSSAEYDLLGDAKIVQGDSKVALVELEPCDLLLTSPPYVNRMSYIRELRPYMYWLRYLDVASDAGELDWKAIGGTWGTATSKLQSWVSQLVTPVEDELSSVCDSIAADGGKNGPLLANYVRKYHHDMWAHFNAVAQHVKPGGAVSYIVGNSSFYGHVVPAQEWYAKMLRSLRFERVEVNVIRKRNSNKALFEYEVCALRP